MSVSGGARNPGFGQVVTWDIDLLSGYEARFMKGAATSVPSGFFSLIAPDLWGAIRNGDFSVKLLSSTAIIMLPILSQWLRPNPLESRC